MEVLQGELLIILPQEDGTMPRTPKAPATSSSSSADAADDSNGRTPMLLLRADVGRLPFPTGVQKFESCIP